MWLSLARTRPIIDLIVIYSMPLPFYRSWEEVDRRRLASRPALRQQADDDDEDNDGATESDEDGNESGDEEDDEEEDEEDEEEHTASSRSTRVRAAARPKAVRFAEFGLFQNATLLAMSFHLCVLGHNCVLLTRPSLPHNRVLNFSPRLQAAKAKAPSKPKPKQQRAAAARKPAARRGKRADAMSGSGEDDNEDEEDDDEDGGKQGKDDDDEGSHANFWGINQSMPLLVYRSAV